MRLKPTNHLLRDCWIESSHVKKQKLPSPPLSYSTVAGPPCSRILAYVYIGTPFTYSANRPQTIVGGSPELSGRDHCSISAFPLVGSAVVFSPECKRIIKAAMIRLVISLTRLSIDVSSGMAGSPEASLEYGRSSVDQKWQVIRTKCEAVIQMCKQDKFSSLHEIEDIELGTGSVRRAVGVVIPYITTRRSSHQPSPAEANTF